jgi:S-(hydroxymethyl)glutathione dehydrogenase / alcohol dehydrogenase
VALAALADGHGAVVIDTIDIDPPGPGEVRVALRAAGVCHTDLDLLRDSREPLVLGHEGAGVIDAVGDGVSDIATGSAVVLNWAMPCGACAACTRSEPFLCEASAPADAPAPPFMQRSRWRGRTVGRAFALGCFATHTTVPRSAVTVLPGDVPWHAACIAGCGVMTGVGSVFNVAQVKPGERVVVLGCGGVGLAAVQGARAAGAARVVAIDTRAARLEEAQVLGATDTLLADGGEDGFGAVITAVRALTGGEGADHVFECTGVPALAFRPLLLVRHGGHVLQLSGAQGAQNVPTEWFRWNKRYTVPLYGACVPERDFPRLWALYRQGRLALDALSAQRYRLEDTAQALDDLRAGRIAKGVIEIA